ncbi:MAG TPA: RNA-binding protein [Cyanobacteria bacterium UBA8156]|jgi:predicted RNA-binding protein with PIN domain|nr:RNA-binding protein [Cyanobacteria bacterium UBA8156]
MAAASVPPSSLLLVDGYNVIHAWQDLQQLQAQAGLADARRELSDLVASYVAFRGGEAVLVFDAYNQNTMANTETVTSQLKVHYTERDETADTYIERLCAQRARHHLHHRLKTLVVTSDMAQHRTTTGYGAQWMSALQFRQEVHNTHRQIRRQERDRTRRPSLRGVLPPDIGDRLNQMRFGP